MTKKNIKKFGFLIILFAFIALFGCQNDDYDKNYEDNEIITKETIKFRINWKTYSGRGEAILAIVDRYNDINDFNYKVELVDGDENLDEIRNQLGEMDSADIYVLPYRYVKLLGSEDVLEDITEDFIETKDLFYDEIWKLSNVDNETFGIPWLGHSMGLIYNKRILDSAGVDPSDINSLDSFVKVLVEIEEKTGVKGIGLVGANHNDLSWMINQFIYGFGGELVNNNGTEVIINSENSKAAIEFYKNILGSHAQNSWVDDTGVEVMKYFRNQEIAFEIQGLWGVTDIWKNGSKFETGVISLEDIGLKPEIGPMMISIKPNINKEKKEVVIDFMKYLISSEAQEMIMKGEYSPEHDAYYPFRLPVRKDIAESTVFNKYPEFIVFLDGFEHPSIDVPVPRWQKIKDMIYAPNLHKVMSDELTVEEFLILIEEQGNKILNDEWSGE